MPKPTSVQIYNHYHRVVHRSRGRWVLQYGDCYRVWEDYVLAPRAWSRFLTSVLGDEPSTASGPGSAGIYVLAVRKHGDSVFPMSCTPGRRGGVHWSAGFYWMIPKSRRDLLQTALDDHARLGVMCRDLGGRPCLYGCHQLDESMKERIYGAAFTRLVQLKHTMDPRSLLNPGFVPRT